MKVNKEIEFFVISFYFVILLRREPGHRQPAGADVQAGEVPVRLGLQQLDGLLHVGGREVDGGQPDDKAGEGQCWRWSRWWRWHTGQE